MEADRLVDDYLRRLEAEAAHLQRSRRAELVAEIREHIETALREEDAANEVAVRNVLERLGPPEEIVEAAEPAPAAAQPRVGGLEIGALIALLVPFVGWFVGVVLVLVSRAWSGREKAVGVALALTPAVLPFLLVTGDAGIERSPIYRSGEDPPLSDASSDSMSAAELVALLGLLLAGLPSAIYLGWRLRRVRAGGG